MPTTPVDLLRVAFAALSEGEQDEAFAALQTDLMRRQAGSESEGERFLASLQRAATELGEVPTIDEYRRLRKELDNELEEPNRIIRHFGSWQLAKEAIDLSATTTVRRIESRFQQRKLGKVWRYTEQTLEETLARCVAHYGRTPQVAEFDWWRRRELELARARGEEHVHLPSATPYRQRWKDWEGALRHFGYDEEAIKQRLDPTSQ